MTTAERGDAEAVIASALRSAEPAKLGEHTYGVVIPADGRVELVDVTERDGRYAPRPRRKSGTYRAHNAETFVGYVEKHGLPETEVWADLQTAQVVAVVNAHTGDDHAGWSDHRLVYSVQHTPAWKAWTARDGQLMSQSDFAELIEDRAIDIVRPSAADMLELAQHFQATNGVAFESSRLLSSGEGQLAYRETIDAKAGRKGTLEIPKDFELGLIPFEGADPFKVVARFRYRINDGALRVGYRLNRPEDVLREAFESVVRQIEDGGVTPVFRGVSP